MPELLILTPCEKVLIDEGKNPTLIVLIENIETHIPAGSTIPAKVTIPKEWAIFTLWKRKPEEQATRHYKQICELVPPKDAPKIRLEVEFDFADRLHRVIHRVVGFPVGVPGIALLTVWLEENGSAVTDTFSYPMQVNHKIVPVSTSVGDEVQHASEARKVN
jgi:hypothetical protein